jgi:hypothetical protein
MKWKVKDTPSKLSPALEMVVLHPIKVYHEKDIHECNSGYQHSDGCAR